MGKLLVFAAFGAAIVLLFTTERGKEIREELEDAAGEIGDTFGELVDTVTASASDLRKLVSKEVSGLSADARERIAAIIDEGTGAAKKLKKTAMEQFA